MNSARATNFMTPKSEIESLFRDEVLNLASTHPFARKLINSGRLSTPCSLEGYSLQTPAAVPCAPGSALLDAPLNGPDGPTWLVQEAQGAFTLLGLGDIALPDLPGLRRIGIEQTNPAYPCFADPEGHALARYGDQMAYLLRPDGHICAAFDSPDPNAIQQALNRAKGGQL
jgi:3-(3-hydroxy-phenyl)propionate hydroxylase